jgi:transcriptional regulator with XRE-family HTH domain
MPKPTLFGRYIRQQRNEAKRSLREVAEELRVSHVYLGEVERGVRGPLKKEHWPLLAKAIPRISLKKLKEYAEQSKPVQMNLNNAEPSYRNLALALARRIQDQSLSDEEIKSLLAILGESKDAKLPR